MPRYVDISINIKGVWHANSIYLSKLQVNTVTNIEVIRQFVFSHNNNIGADIRIYLPEKVIIHRGR